MSDQANTINRYAVVGNPISHSLSPQIHQAFAKQAGISLSYEAIELPEDGFASGAHELQQQGFKGLNVTVPFKQEAWQLCDKKSPRAEGSGAVNTIIMLSDGNIAGDNTDGVGLTRDLVSNHGALIKRRKVLVLGAGGPSGDFPGSPALQPEVLAVEDS